MEEKTPGCIYCFSWFLRPEASPCSSTMLRGPILSNQSDCRFDTRESDMSGTPCSLARWASASQRTPKRPLQGLLRALFGVCRIWHFLTTWGRGAYHTTSIASSVARSRQVEGATLLTGQVGSRSIPPHRKYSRPFQGCFISSLGVQA
jgi:hypothetical protein